MMYLWTNEDIEKILMQLDEQHLPFEKYTFSGDGDSLHLLGKGGFALVYEASLRSNLKNKFAIKVIGFGDKRVDSGFFNASAKAQKDLSFRQENVIKVYDYTELCVWLDESNHIIRAEKTGLETQTENCLKLQFIVMEKSDSVIFHSKAGKTKLTIPALADYDEREILKVAYDIGNALTKAHSMNILHRDVKLENIFYSEKDRRYKLGDFGIAKVTDDGMATTVTFTRGYGAPEVVGSLDEKYDNTADIYSFGILLYVLCNGLRFPDSENYNVNSKVQYSKGYLLPRPAHGSDGLSQIIEKMCRYDPDDRYQSVDEVMLDLETLMFSYGIRYEKEHSKAALISGITFLLIGTAAWKLTFRPMMEMDLSRILYLLIGLSIGKFFLCRIKKSTTFLTAAILGTGIYWLVSAGISWLKILYLACIIFSSGNLGGIVSGVLLSVVLADLMEKTGGIRMQDARDYRWTAVVALSLAGVLLYQFMVLGSNDRKMTKNYLSKNRYWIFISILYAIHIPVGLILQNGYTGIYGRLLGSSIMNEIIDLDLAKVGIVGFSFCVVWMIRERMLVHMEQLKKKQS